MSNISKKSAMNMDGRELMRSKVWTSMAFLVFVAFAILMKMGFHEMWKDEWQAFLVARDMSWSEMLGFLYYEGHGALWYIWLKVFVSFGLQDGAVTLPWAHGIVLVAFYFVVFFKIEAPLWVKVLILLGYFPLFEYGLIARGYVWILFCIALICWRIQRDKLDFWFLLGLFLLTQTEVYGVILAFSLLLYCVVRALPEWSIQKWKEFVLPITVTVVGSLIFVWTVFPRGSVGQKQTGVYTENPWLWENIEKVVSGQIGQSFLTPIYLKSPIELGILGSVAVLFLIAFIFRRRAAFWSMGIYMIGALVFGVFFYSGGLRHWGTAVLCLYSMMLLDWPQIEKSKWSLGAAILLLGLQLPYSYLAASKEIRRPFSYAQEVAEFILENTHEESIVVGINPMEMTPVIGYMDRPMYFLPEGQEQTYFRWLEKIYIPPEDELFLFARFKNSDGLLLCSDRKLDSGRYPRLQLWKAFDRRSLKKENYYLYTLQTR